MKQRKPDVQDVNQADFQSRVIQQSQQRHKNTRLYRVRFHMIQFSKKREV